MEFGKIHVDIIDGFEKFQNIRVRSFSEFVVEKYNYEVIKEDENMPPDDIRNREVDARVKVNKNLIWMTSKKGFFAQLLSKLNIYGSSDPRYLTMCTNGFNIQYHPDFVLSQSDAAVRFVLCHEILHCVGDHMSRRGNRNPLIWNYACDYAINPILNADVVSGQFEWPRNSDGTRMGLYEEKYEGMRAEDIYDDLVKDIEQQQKAAEAFKDDPKKGIHVVDSDDELEEPDGPESIVQEVETGESEIEEEPPIPDEETDAIYGQPGDIIGIKRGPNRGYAKIVSVNPSTGEHEIVVLTKDEASKELAKNYQWV